MNRSIKLCCDDEQNRGFEALDKEATGAIRYSMHVEVPQYRMKRELNREELILLGLN